MLTEKNQTLDQPLTARLLLAYGVIGPFLVAGVFVTDPAQGYPPGTPDGPAIHTTLHGGPTGLLERISIMIGMAWLVLLAARLLRKNTTSRLGRGNRLLTTL